MKPKISMEWLAILDDTSSPFLTLVDVGKLRFLAQLEDDYFNVTQFIG